MNNFNYKLGHLISSSFVKNSGFGAKLKDAEPFISKFLKDYSSNSNAFLPKHFGTYYKPTLAKGVIKNLLEHAKTPAITGAGVGAGIGTLETIKNPPPADSSIFDRFKKLLLRGAQGAAIGGAGGILLPGLESAVVGHQRASEVLGGKNYIIPRIKQHHLANKYGPTMRNDAIIKSLREVADVPNKYTERDLRHIISVLSD